MKRKIITLLTALVVFACAAVPVSAAGFSESFCGTRLWCWIPSCVQPSCPSETPDTPAQPGTPETPEEPDAPETPEKPDIPETPEQPDDSGSVIGVLAYEQEVVRLVNVERASYGLPALSIRADLCQYARVKSQDMHDSGYFSHTSPNYGSPFDMMKSFGITYSHAGENIAMGYSTPEVVVSAWMNSEGHRANIFSASYTELGVGYVADGGYWTQWFVG